MVFKSEKQRRGFFSRIRDLKTLPGKIEEAREQRQERKAIELEKKAVAEQAKLEGLRRRLEARVHVQRAKEGRLQLIKKQSDELEAIKKEERDIKGELFRRSALGRGVAGVQKLAKSKAVRKAFSEPKTRKRTKKRKTKESNDNVFGL